MTTECDHWFVIMPRTSRLDVRQASEALSARLGDTEAVQAWIEQLGALPALGPAPLPPSAAIPSILRRFEIPDEVIGLILPIVAHLRDDPVVAWGIERAVTGIRIRMGQPRTDVWMPSLVADGDLLRQWFPLLVVLAAVPYTRRYHAKLGIDAQMSRRTLANVWGAVADHRRLFGSWGSSRLGLLSRTLDGTSYQLGRLIFERIPAGDRWWSSLAAAGQRPCPATVVLGVHIPRGDGPPQPSSLR